MGKYMRKSKTSGEVALMDVAQSSLGVRTRARTLALQRLQKLAAPEASSGGGASYLQLRSRRLAKPPIFVTKEGKRQKQIAKEGTVQNPNPNLAESPKLRVADTESASIGSSSHDPLRKQIERDGERASKDGNQENHSVDLGDVEASFGENVLEFEGRERSTRESTPCSFIRDPETIRAPGSSTKPSFSAETHRRSQSIGQRQIPTTNEMEEFFTGAEAQQLKQFVEKYNYDPVNDEPLPGRYEWVKLDE